MGFEGSAGAAGLGRYARASVNKREILAGVAGGANATTDQLRIVGLCNVSINVIQTAGNAGSTFQLFLASAGGDTVMQIGPPNALVLAVPPVPTFVNFQGIVGNNVVVQCSNGAGAVAGSFTVLMMACA